MHCTDCERGSFCLFSLSVGNISNVAIVVAGLSSPSGLPLSRSLLLVGCSLIQKEVPWPAVKAKVYRLR
jgi:hypothetical protein